jgi:alkylation response protein AidB-like acyl-CoA dehydrogenase
VTEIDAARLLTYQAARAVEQERDIERLPAQAKLLASRVAVHAATQAIQICGAQGMLETQPFGRYLRDAKAYEIAGGSSEILKNTIAKHL